MGRPVWLNSANTADLIKAIDTMPDGFALFDAEGNLTHWNRRFVDIHPQIQHLVHIGATLRDLVRQDLELLAEQGHIENVDQALEDRLSENGAPYSERNQLQADGRWVRVRTMRTLSDGIVMIYTDVTETLAARDSLDRNTRLLRATLESISQGIAAFDADMRLTMWNSRYFEMFDLPFTFAHVGTPLVDIVSYLEKNGEFDAENLDPLMPYITEDWVERVTTAWSGKTRVSWERRARHGRILDVSAVPLTGGGAVVTFVDVTDRRHSARMLQESEQRYALAAAGSNDGLWDWDLANGKIFLSPCWKEMLGYSDPEIADTPDEWFSRIHPDDVYRVTDQLDSHLEGAVANFESEHRMRHFDGSFRWMLTRGLAVRDPDGTALRIAGSQTDITDRKQAEEQIIHEALHDGLTGLPNRTLFLDLVRQSLVATNAEEAPHFAIIQIDLDRFKVVNESLGHMHGDSLIISVARRLQGAVGSSDTIARLGGDEFVVLAGDVGSKADADSIANKLSAAISAPFRLAGREIFMSGSIGVAHSSDAYDWPEDMLRDSELAMYTAKKSGPSRAVAFTSSMRGSPFTRLDIETDLRRALDRDELAVHYQPIVELESGRISGFEALLRWFHPTRGVVSPGEFIPLAEEMGLIGDIGEWVVRTACGDLQDWLSQKMLDRPVDMAVNLSTRQFVRPHLVEEIERLLGETGIEATSVKLEITESVLMDNARVAVDMLEQMRELGIRICVDDFGTGYSSLSYLHQFPIDTLKIDRSFIQDLGRNPENLEIVRTIKLLASNLRMSIVAEGVETGQHLSVLRDLGCEFAQGYYFAKPVDAEGAERLLIEDRAW